MSELNFLISPDYTAFYVARSVFLSVSTLLLVGLVYLLFKTGYLKARWFKNWIELISEEPYGTSGAVSRWQQIEGYLESESKSKHKLAIMEAENLLDKSLKKMEFEGDNVEERLQSVPQGKIENLEEVKLAHELRNDVAYDPDYQLQKEEAVKALEIYKKALEDLEVI